MDHEAYLRQAITLGKMGMDRGHGGPFGAVIVRDGEVIGEGWNQVLRKSDPTAHAEIVAIREATSAQGHHWLEGTTLYSSCKPCPMCYASALWTHVPQIYYAATAEDAAEIGFDDARFERAFSIRKGENIIIVEHIAALRDEARRVMREWPALGQGY